MRHSFLPSSSQRSAMRSEACFDLTHHLPDTRPRFVEDLAEELPACRWCSSDEDDRTNAALRAASRFVFASLALVRDNGAGDDVETEVEEHFEVAAVARFAAGQMESRSG